MCGIAGICHINGPEGISSDTLKDMIGVLNHRGQDEVGIYLDFADRMKSGYTSTTRLDWVTLG